MLCDSFVLQVVKSICDFHREQSWDRWLNDSKHGVAENKNQILSRYCQSIFVSSPPMSVVSYVFVVGLFHFCYPNVNTLPGYEYLENSVLCPNH